MEQWEPWNGEVLPLEREPDNPEDNCAVAIKRNNFVKLLDMFHLTKPLLSLHF